MTQSYDPNSFTMALPTQERQWVQSIQQVLNGSVDMGTPTSNASSAAGINAGIPSQFKRGNGSGILVRIAANGNTSQGAPYNWTSTTGIGVPINHGLDRQPIGFILADCDKDVRVYRTAAPTNQIMMLASTDKTASVTVYIF